MAKLDTTVVIVDYGCGNVGSVHNMLRKVGADSCVSSSPDIIVKANKLILPGVGSFDNGMKNLAERGLREVLDEKILRQSTPILGICLGMQLLTKGSEEGILPGLGWIDAETVRFRFPENDNRLKIPHMGWNTIKMMREHPLWAIFDDPPRYYFVHSYHVNCHNPEDVIATSSYGIEFTAAVGRANIMGVQFHPEKSHKYGLRLLERFARMS